MFLLFLSLIFRSPVKVRAPNRPLYTGFGSRHKNKYAYYRYGIRYNMPDTETILGIFFISMMVLGIKTLVGRIFLLLNYGNRYKNFLQEEYA